MPTPDSSEQTRRVRLLASQSTENVSKRIDGYGFYYPIPSAIGLNNFLPSTKRPIVITTVTPSPPPPPVSFGSMAFTVSPSRTNISFSSDSNLRIGSNAFTIEWFQYYESGDTFAIVFSIGAFPFNDIAVSYSNVTPFLFVSGGAGSNWSVPVTKNQWQHIALVGNTSNVKVYLDGSNVYTRPISYNLTSISDLYIGNQTADVTSGNYEGLITNFRWTVGNAIYTSNFTPPTSPLTPVSGTQLLLLADSSSNLLVDSSPAGRTASNNGVTYSTNSPFG